MTLYISVAICIAFSVFIIIPFLIKYKSVHLDDSTNDQEPKSAIDLNKEIISLEGEKNKLYSDLKDIEFDYNLGKITENDYKELRSKYMDRTAELLRKIDEINIKPGSGTGDVIEDEINNFKKNVNSN
ncbi:MAG: hypothetical protein V3U54_06695 [Thermodesulfobacteriota bacterium]